MQATKPKDCDSAVIGALTVADVELESILEMDNFTIEDRKELMKQGFILEQFHKEVHDLKAAIRESLTRNEQRFEDERKSVSQRFEEEKKAFEAVSEDHEGRLFKLERLVDRGMAVFWVGGIIFTAVQTAIALAIHWSK